LDGRANNSFNGATPFGPNDAKARILVKTGDLAFVTEQIGLANGSAASQADGPALNDVEMSCSDKSFAILGRKLVDPGLMPLGTQTVAVDDSVLWPYRNPSGPGLNKSYLELIQAAFNTEFIDNKYKLNPDGSLNAEGYTQLERNFPLVWGLAIQLYETTLKADDTPLDRFLKGDSKALSSAQLRGFNIFKGKGSCVKCHAGAELTDAAVRLRNVGKSDSGEVGFHFIGNRPAADDPGRSDFNPAVVVGAVKTPQLRDVALTRPYFAQGGALTLDQVVDAYSRGQNLPDKTRGVDKEIKVLHLSDQEKHDLVAFLRMGLTDHRVACEMAPFDHPSLSVPNGHVGDQFAVKDSNNDGKADDEHLLIPAVGKGGLSDAHLACLSNDDGSANR
jgi:hypothetical protein